MLRRLAVTLAASSLLTFGLGGVAHADNIAIVDARGDMWKDDGSRERPQRAPRQESADIRRVAVNHAQRAIIVRTKFVQLRRTGAFTLMMVRVRTNAGLVRFATLGVGRVTESGWRGEAELTRRDGRVVECEMGHDVNYATNVARLRIPRTCLNAPRWVQATVASVHATGGRRFTFYFDNAHNEGFRSNGWTKRLRRR